MCAPSVDKKSDRLRRASRGRSKRCRKKACTWCAKSRSRRSARSAGIKSAAGEDEEDEEVVEEDEAGKDDVSAAAVRARSRSAAIVASKMSAVVCNSVVRSEPGPADADDDDDDEEDELAGKPMREQLRSDCSDGDSGTDWDGAEHRDNERGGKKCG